MAGSNLWTCPKCGNRFTSPNMWHSCGQFDLDSHFIGADPSVKATFHRLLEAIEGYGRVTVIPQKTRIAIQAEVRFAGGVARKHWFDAALWLTRPADHPTLHKMETFGDSYYHWFRLRDPSEVDPTLISLIGEAYQVGLRRHLRQKRSLADPPTQ